MFSHVFSRGLLQIHVFVINNGPQIFGCFVEGLPGPHLHFLITTFRQWPGKVSKFLLFSPFFVSTFRNFSCFVEGPHWPHLPFRQRPCKISKFSLFSLFRGGPSLTSFAFPSHFSSIALQKFEIFVIFFIFVVFVFFAVSSRAFLDLICISSSLFLNGPAKFWDFCYFRNFRSTLAKFCNFRKFRHRVQSWTSRPLSWTDAYGDGFFNDRHTL